MAPILRAESERPSVAPRGAAEEPSEDGRWPAWVSGHQEAGCPAGPGRSPPVLAPPSPPKKLRKRKTNKKTRFWATWGALVVTAGSASKNQYERWDRELRAFKTKPFAARKPSRRQIFDQMVQAFHSVPFRSVPFRKPFRSHPFRSVIFSVPFHENRSVPRMSSKTVPFRSLYISERTTNPFCRLCVSGLRAKNPF